MSDATMDFVFLNIHRGFNITNIIPQSPGDDGSLEIKRYSVDFVSQ